MSSKSVHQLPEDATLVWSMRATGEQLHSNQIYSWHDWHMIWVGDLFSVFSHSAFIIVQLQVSDGCLRALAVHSGGDGLCIPVSLHPGEPPAPRPSLRRHMLTMHQHLMTACETLDRIELWPSQIKDISIHHSVVEPDPRLPHSPSRKAHQVSKTNWRRLGRHLGLRCTPELPYTPKAGTHVKKSTILLQRQASSPARVCMSSRSFITDYPEDATEARNAAKVLHIGPVVCSLRRGLHGSRLCLQLQRPTVSEHDSSRTNPPILEALLFAEDSETGFSRVRISPLFGEEFNRDTRIHTHAKRTNITVGRSEEVPVEKPAETRSRSSQSRQQSASLLTLMSELDVEFLIDQSKSSSESSDCGQDVPELYDFDVLFGVDHETLRPSTGDDCNENLPFSSVESSNPLYYSPKVNEELLRLDEMLFPREIVYETYSSGRLPVWLHVDAQCAENENKEREQRAHLRVQTTRRQAVRLSERLLRLLDTETGVNRKLRTGAVASPRGYCSTLRSIVAGIWSAFDVDKSSQSTVTLKSLSVEFAKLNELLRLGEQALTTYELIVSGLVEALLLCLSADHAGRWNCPVLPVGLDSRTSLLWYLRERRRIFVQHMLPDCGPTYLGCFTRRLVQALELMEHLPLRLFALVSNQSDTTASDDIHKSNSAVPIASKKVHFHSTKVNCYEDATLVSFPLGVIRAAKLAVDRQSNVVKLNEAQQFSDCVDETELAALHTLCPSLTTQTGEELTVPGLQQIDGKLALMLEKVTFSRTDTDDDASDSSVGRLHDWSGSTVRVNPLITAAQLESFILRMSATQWYEHPRIRLRFWQQLELESRRGITFPPPTNGITSTDTLGGVIDWLATDAGSLPIEGWVNPAVIGLVTVAASAGNRPACVFGPRAGSLIGGYPVRCTGFGCVVLPRRLGDPHRGPTLLDNNMKSKFGHLSSGVANSTAKPWIAVDLGLQLQPTAYSLAYLRQAEITSSLIAPRNWNLEASNDGVSWTILRSHVDDSSIQSLSGSRGTWKLHTSTFKSPYYVDTSLTERSQTCDNTEAAEQQPKGWRFFKIQSTGPNSNGGRELALGGLEFYGTVHFAHESILSVVQLDSKINERPIEKPDNMSEHPRLSSVTDTDHNLRQVRLKERTLSPVESTDSNLRSTISKSLESGEQQKLFKQCAQSESGHGGESPDASPSRAQNINNLLSKEERKSCGNSFTDASLGEDEDENENPDDDDDDGRAASLPGRFLESLGLLEMSSDADPLLQYLLLSSENSSDEIRQFLQTIRGHDDESQRPPLPQSKSTCRSTAPVYGHGRPLRIIDPKNSREDTTIISEPDENAVVEPCVVSSRSTADAPTQPKDASLSNKTPSTAMPGTGDDIPHDSLWFIDQDVVDSVGQGSQPNSNTFALNTEDAEALEFADAIEAIIQSNISSGSPPYSHALAPVVSERRDLIAENCELGPERNTTCLRKWKTSKPHPVSDSQKQTALQPSTESSDGQIDWFGNRCDEKGVASDPELPSELSSSQESKPTKNGAYVLSSSQTHLSSKEDTLLSARLSTPPANADTSTNLKKSFKSVVAQVDTSCNLSVPPSTGKTTKPQRRRPRRPRPRPMLSASSTLTHQAPAVQTRLVNSSTRPMPLTWDEAVETLRLPIGLIPVFNPNPGVTNASATMPFVLCNPPVVNRSSSDFHSRNDVKPRLTLCLYVVANSKQIAEIVMRNRNSTVFQYVQLLSEQLRHAQFASSDGPDDVGSSVKLQEKQYQLKLGYRAWVPEDNHDSVESVTDVVTNRWIFKNRASAVPVDMFLNWDDLRLTPSMRHPIQYTDTGMQLTMLTEETELSNVCFTSSDFSTLLDHHPPTTPENLLRLIKLIYQLSGLATPKPNFPPTSYPELTDTIRRTSTPVGRSKRISTSGIVTSTAIGTIQPEDFVSSRLTKKLLRQIRDPLALASGALPHWCFSLSHRLRHLFTFTARLELLKAAGFGSGRSVIWLQNQSLAKTSAFGTNVPGRSHSVGSSGSSGNNSTRMNTMIIGRNVTLPSSGSNAANCLVTGTRRNIGSATQLLLLRPSVLTRILDSSTTASDENGTVEVPLLEPVSSTIESGLPNDVRISCSRDLDGLWNCLLARSGRYNGTRHDNDSKTNLVGRLLKEYVRVPRLPHELLVDANDRVSSGRQPLVSRSCLTSESGQLSISTTFWDWAACLMEEHASRKAELEIQFLGEDGTGLGPTLEFYSLLAAELRRRDGLMWVVDDLTLDDPPDERRPAMPTVASMSTLDSRSRLDLTEHESMSDTSVDLGIEANAYVNTTFGLFPAAWPADRVPNEVLYRFYILGITVAKCLQDNRRIDLPFSTPLLKLLSAYGSVSAASWNVTADSGANSPDFMADQLATSSSTSGSCIVTLADVKQTEHMDFSRVSSVESALSSITLNRSTRDDAHSDIGEFLLSLHCRRLRRATGIKPQPPEHWLTDLLDLDDFCTIYPERANLFRKIVQFCRQKYVLSVRAGPHNVDPKVLEDLAIKVFGCSLEDMCIYMEFLPPSKLFFGGSGLPLSDEYDWENKGGEPSNCTTKHTQSHNTSALNLGSSKQAEVEQVTVHNIERFLTRTLSFCLDKGIRKQLDAFKDGFECVLPLSWLALFNETELDQLIAGDSVAEWSREDLLAYTVPCLGFTHQSATYQMLINVLSNFDLLERRAFLQFTTGCSSLPPGGLKNLYPRLRVVRKEAGTGSFPSVNTCVHYLKLPEYQSERELRTALLRASREIGFYLN
ncbi:hypothetical protein PHET_01042 [Paragonimus heterotremus]|uniref:E3 ubiquitin-protein ligase n=1 Tax=Paragonimus heterotremus TaxID=100268 RepID=A0A8J4T5Z2_9TREM|nr:hypothetical protein PHET_01042 [Paragonimus heterotremus]